MAQTQARPYNSEMETKNTTAKGNAFRDALEKVLSAAGFTTTTETKIGH